MHEKRSDAREGSAADSWRGVLNHAFVSVRVGARPGSTWLHRGSADGDHDNNNNDGDHNNNDYDCDATGYDHDSARNNSSDHDDDAGGRDNGWVINRHDHRAYHHIGNLDDLIEFRCSQHHRSATNNNEHRNAGGDYPRWNVFI